MRPPKKTAGIVLLAFALSLIPPAAWAVKPPTVAERRAASAKCADEAAPGKTPSGDPVVKITPPPTEIARRIVYFPLDLPAWILRIATLPVGMLFEFIEKKQVIERVADALSNEKKTIWAYPIIEGGAGSGFGGGAGFNAVDLFGRGVNLKLTYRNHINLSQSASAAVGKPEMWELADRPVSLAGGVKWSRPTNDSYFGIGPSTTQSMRSYYMANNTSIGAGAAWEFYQGLTANAGIAYDVGTSGGNTYGSGPAVNAAFPAADIPGFGRWIHYFVPGLKLQYDTRDNISLPSRGGIYTLSFSRYQGLGSGDFDFNQYELDARHFFPLWRPRMVLALHGGIKAQQETGGGKIPFYKLSTLDVNSPLRGFTSGRFHDRNLIVLNAEYRFPIWEALDGVLFFDTGRVFHSFADLTMKDFKLSGGGGLRMRAMGLMLLRFDLAYGGEGIQTLVGISKSL
ncbi:MAG TPA: BamA/TamA family outer membrane protein [bacterium]|nr:BamA/TamA family outer membrane protein [bacterium]